MDGSAETTTQSSWYRWLQLVLGIVCMAAIANLQYGWALFVNPMDAAQHWGRPAIQVAFTIFVLTETWLIPLEGYIADRFGTRAGVLGGGVLCALGWSMNAYAQTLPMLYAAAFVGGLGVGAVVSSCFNNALRWFPDRRGLAMGLTASGVGFGSALTVAPLANMIASSGYRAAFLYFAIGQGIVVVVLGLFLAVPSPGEVRLASGARVGAGIGVVRDYRPMEMLKTPVFWVLYLMFVLVAAGGLMATAQLGVIAKDFGISGFPVSILGIMMPALVFALTLDRTINGVSRPFFGWLSDFIGRENTMAIAFFTGALGIFALYWLGDRPVEFVILSGVVFFASGEIYSLFPTVSTDTFGTGYAATNASTLYTAKGAAALLVPLSSLLAALTGGWQATFVTASVMNAVAAALALFVLKPMRRRMVAPGAVPAPGAAPGVPPRGSPTGAR